MIDRTVAAGAAVGSEGCRRRMKSHCCSCQGYRVVDAAAVAYVGNDGVAAVVVDDIVTAAPVDDVGSPQKYSTR